MARSRHRAPRRLWLWRWRANPLRRRSDVVEGRLLLAVCGLAVAVGAFVGAATAHDVERNLNERRAERQPVAAVLTEDAPATVSATAGTGGKVWAEVRWTEADGSPRTGSARVEPGTDGGARVRVWLDRHGNVVPAPLDRDDAALQGVALGTVTAVGTAVTVSCLGWVVHRRAERRRMAAWDTEWARIGPQWGQRTS
ncbi:hypothetical protein E4N62_42805 [Streptomyces sp. MNU76]|uniref:Rv1733c family protein n=1 Tax=Streptomyces sp. MNU76 TaxID=2560026 RepID=UPI001E2B81B8|nr:hypothetical protein [Streptomyces sp. MNU76]MCC9711365.1 hypothetical protein [Streptomyces sp. MNU76]